MSDYIRVDTAQLRDESNELRSIAEDLNRLSGILGSASSVSGSLYEGQLANAVSNHAGWIVSESSNHQTQSNELADELLRRAEAFEAANQESSSTLLGTMLSYSPEAGASAKLSGGVFPSLYEAGLLVNLLSGIEGVWNSVRKTSSDIWNYVSELPSDIFPNMLAASKRSLDLVSNISSRTQLRKAFELIGARSAYDDIIVKGIPYRGKVDSFFRYNKWMKRLGWINLGIDTADDLINRTYGDDYIKTLGVNATDAGLNYVMALTGVGTAILVGNGVVQLGGNLQVAAQKSASDTLSVNSEVRQILLTDANMVENAVDRADFGNVTRQLSETIYEAYNANSKATTEVYTQTYEAVKTIWNDPSVSSLQQARDTMSQTLMTNKSAVISSHLSMMFPGTNMVNNILSTEEGRRGMLETAKALGTAVDGLGDYAISTISSRINTKIAKTTKAISYSRILPESLKQAINQVATETIMPRNQQAAQDLIDKLSFE